MSPPSTIEWSVNHVRQKANQLILLLVGPSSAVLVASLVGFWIEPANSNWLLGILAIIPLIFVLYPVMLRSLAPRSVAITNQGLLIDWRARTVRPGDLVSIRFTEILRVGAEGRDTGEPVRVAGIASVALRVVSLGGIALRIGPVDPEIAERIHDRLKPDQWEIRGRVSPTLPLRP